MTTIERKLDEKFLENFLNAPSVSGYEQPAQRIFREFIKPYVQEMKTDVMGNVIGVKNPNGNPKIMLAGHCDEVGGIVKYISKEGFIHFYANGLDAHILPSSRVRIITKDSSILGVIGKKAIHLQESDERTKVVKIRDQYIDVGARSREEVEKMGIRIGDSLIFDYYFEKLGVNGDVISRCFDDKIGAFIVAEILKRLHGEEITASVYGVSTTQEETGLRGAVTSAFSINPEIALVYDVDFVMDTPSSEEKYHGRVSMGGGPIVAVGPNMNAKLAQFIIATAKELEIPVQVIAEPRGTGTDANVIQMDHSGVIVALFGIPNRYMHSYSEIVNLNDVEAIIRLSVEVIKRIQSTSIFLHED